MRIREIKEIMKNTCFGSLAYCCELSKPCDSRNNVLKRLGITKKDFLKLKEDFDNNLIELLIDNNLIELSKVKSGKNKS